MNEKTRKVLGYIGFGLIAAGSVSMYFSGADLSETSGIVGLAFAAIAALVTLINGVKK